MNRRWFWAHPRAATDRFSDIRALVEAHAAAQDANLRRLGDVLLGKFVAMDIQLTRTEAHLNLR